VIILFNQTPELNLNSSNNKTKHYYKDPI
jgi:hypothetical protein